MNTKLNLPSIKDLREQGWKIRVSHFRFPTKNSDLTAIKEMKDSEGKYIFPPESLGGKVEIESRDPNGNEFRGNSVCSKVEPFCKARGRNLALARAIGDKTTKFKAGDEVYRIGSWQIDKIKITKSDVHFYLDDDGEVVRNEIYWQDQLRDAGYNVEEIVQGVLFSTKEELINSIA